MSQTNTANATANNTEPKPKLSKAEQAPTEASARSLGQQNSSGAKSFDPSAKNSRVEQARINGSKSKGPVTEGGKSRSALNHLTHGKTANINAKWLPIDNGVLTPENRIEAFHLFDAFRTQLQPKSALEIDLVKMLTHHHWHLKRILRVESALLQSHVGQITNALIMKMQETHDQDPSDTQFLFSGYQAAANGDEKTLRTLARARRDHERAIRELMRRLKELQKDFPLLEAEVFDPVQLASDYGLTIGQQPAPDQQPASEEPIAEEAQTEETMTEDFEPEATTDQVDELNYEPKQPPTPTEHNQQLAVDRANKEPLLDKFPEAA